MFFCKDIFVFFSQVLLWETRPPRGGPKPLSKKERDIINPMGVPLTFKHLDLTWRPFLRVNRKFLISFF
jgi:hypothetical protein